ncbi:TIGR02266 family protein [Myxococcota bacterium]|nr:TIGR02266 family protein [Myxococcota bacterium]
MPTPVKLTIKFKADTLEEFVERYGVYVSQGGIFVRTKKPLSVGSLVDFEFKLQNGGALLKGMGTVVWTREHDPARRGAPAGMGLRYDSLDEESISILTRILSLKGSDAGAEAEVPAEAAQVTSPGQQQEKTRVASMDVIAALRDNANDEAPAAEPLGSQPKAMPKFDLDAPVDLDSGLPGASPPLDLDRPMDEVPPVIEPKKDIDEDSTPLPQSASPLLPMSEIREPFDPKSTMKDDSEEEAGLEEDQITAVAKLPVTEAAAEVSDVLAELKEMASKSVLHEDGDTGGLRLPKPAEPEEEKSDDHAESSQSGEKLPVKAGKELDDKDLFDQIDQALQSGKDEKAGKEETRDKVRDRVPAKKTPVVVSEEKKGGGSMVILLVLLVAALAVGALYYWKFMLPTKKDDAPRQPGTEKPVKPPVDMGMEPVVDMPADMPVDMPAEPVMDATPVVSDMGMEPDMVEPDMVEPDMVEPDMVEPDMGMEPLVVTPPEAAPDKTCAEGEFAIAVTSVPSGAGLTINLEKKTEKTPATFCFKALRGYTIAFDHPDFLPATEFIPRLTQKTAVHKQLVTYPRRILVQSDPKGAVVYIDGEKAGNTTISKTYEKPQEIWKIEIKMPGYKDEAIEIRLDDPRWDTRTRLKSYDLYKKLQKN